MKQAGADSKKKRSSRALSAALLALFVTVGVVAIIHIASIQANYAAAQEEYEALREASSAAFVSGQAVEEGERAPDLSDVNPDYRGWIRIANTAVDYPVVQGTDNAKYLTTTFKGEQNPAGAIFMDFRCAQGFGSALSILYGHNMKDGSMFAQVKRYPEGAPTEHQDITILTPQAAPQTYRIFAVVTTNASDAVYALLGEDTELITNYMAALGAPQDARQFIVLSTCVSEGDNSERRLALAARVG
jgi:SrtB family sortase